MIKVLGSGRASNLKHSTQQKPEPDTLSTEHSTSTSSKTKFQTLPQPHFGINIKWLKNKPPSPVKTFLFFDVERLPVSLFFFSECLRNPNLKNKEQAFIKFDSTFFS